MSMRWDPFRDLMTLQEHLNRLFDVSVSQHRHEEGMAGWHPPADVCESETEVRLFVEIAGMAPDSIDVKVEKNRLILRGERRRPHAPEQTYHQTEILMGPFHRSFALQAEIDSEGVEANYNQGILEIVLPKKREQHKVLPVKVKSE